ncbi:NAD(P)H-quinone oxidoreductase, partial [Acinetobacter baumannii]
MNLPTTMKIVEITVPGGPEVLKLQDSNVPVPQADEVLIEVKAAGINRP